MDEEDRLIASPPMDMVIKKRQAALDAAAEQRRLKKESKPLRVKDSYNRLLYIFADKYFKGHTRYDSLSSQEQKALAKICLRHSLKKTFATLLPLSAGWITLILEGKNIGEMVGLGALGSVFLAVSIIAVEAVLDISNSFHFYESFLFIKNHFSLKRKKLLEPLFK